MTELLSFSLRLCAFAPLRETFLQKQGLANLLPIGRGECLPAKKFTAPRFVSIIPPTQQPHNQEARRC